MFNYFQIKSNHLAKSSLEVEILRVTARASKYVFVIYGVHLLEIIVINRNKARYKTLIVHISNKQTGLKIVIIVLNIIS